MFTHRFRGLLNLYVLALTGLIVAFFLTFAAATRYIPWLPLVEDVNLELCAVAIAVGMIASARSLGKFSWRSRDLDWHEAARMATRQAAGMAVALFTLIVATKDQRLSRLFIAHFLVIAWALLLVANRKLPRYVAALAFSRRHRMPTLFVGQASDLGRLNSWIEEKIPLGLLPVGYLSDDNSAGGVRATGPYLGRSADLAQVLRESEVAQVILLSLPSQEEGRAILCHCQQAGCRLAICDDAADRLPALMAPVIDDGRFFFVLQEEPLEDPFNRAAKRIFDLAVSLPVVVLVLPVLSLLIAIMQRIQAPGPLFFVRPRGGHMRREFRMMKFRSMYHHGSHDMARDAVQTRPRDDRVFAFGRFLRRFSLDEFPQFWNVLVGEMSVVGPRPHLLTHDDEFSQIATFYRTRQFVKPGITGLAQVRGFRGETTDPALLRQRIEWDIHYITHWSPWLDVQVVLKTVWQVIFPPRSAY